MNCNNFYFLPDISEIYLKISDDGYFIDWNSKMPVLISLNISKTLDAEYQTFDAYLTVVKGC